ncbi:methylmalonyl-CoA mutase family protein [Kaistia geumhonensis]|uniref:Methylmalonyl-CoA mutase n=1 Tax=Kaistia geumhonensis TaxID=410839 RepID=A0ABU0M3S1_9HYPH|nr:methylmalonyl-CoA mutase family protein [Kaistia geumhonensis]MCX5479163.1 methylmalonyl-CoA mutase family protein [Kaistia geumhonensis]MDQ0515617.1 methylmalonyl-CoA mutase [Kaistia geumhonensis]
MAPHEGDEARAAWLRLVERTLGGRPASSLAARIEPSMLVEPLAPAGRLPPLWSRGGSAWTRLQRLDRDDIASARRGLENGADGIEFVLAGAPTAWRGGIEHAALAPLLGELPIDRLALRFSAGSRLEVAATIDDAIAAARLDPSLMRVSFGLDPIGGAARGGATLAKGQRDALVATVERLAGRGYRGPVLSADARPIHAAGGFASTELAYAAAAYVSLLRALLDGGVVDGVALAAIDVALAADADQFVTMSKLRAMRLLQARILAAAGLPPAALPLHAETAWSMLAAEDEGSNVVRATIAALAAALGGADSIAVLPHRAASAAGDAEAERLALTLQAVLAEEARLHAVDDPGAGSGTVESLTLALAEAAWSLLQEIEGLGGLPAAESSSWLAARIAADREDGRRRLASGEAAIIGVTLHRADGAPLPDPVDEAVGDPFGARRRAAPFERRSS